MQSDVPPLPISCLTDNIRLRRNNNFKASTPATQNNSKNNLLCKNSNNLSLLLPSRKQLRPIIAGPSPYKNSARFNPPDTGKSGKSVIGQRVSSAKMLRIKQLQNQLADAHFHLNELSNENKLLKAIQKRQDTALKRYEGRNAELPRIINTHHEDLRILQSKYKKLKAQYKETNDTLKDKENELHSLQVQNKKLLQLSKDRHLGEREKLQTQVFDLNHRIDQQDEIIQTLKRKLALESKYLKHQLHAEMVKHKETQKQLQDTQLKLRSLEELSEQREKRSYQASRIFFFNKDRATVTSQSLTNLNESRSEHLIKGHGFRRRRSEAAGQSLPALNESSPLARSQSQESPKKSSHHHDMPASMTELNFEQLRHNRLQKSPAMHRTAPFSSSRGSVRDSPIKESQLEESINVKENEIVEDVRPEIPKKSYELPKSLKKEYGYATSDDDEKSKDDDTQLDGAEKASESLNLTSRSRLLHARLVNSASEGVRTSKTQVSIRSRSLTKENMENIAENDTEIKYDRDSVITVIARDMLKDDVDTNTNYSNSDLESEIEIPIDFNADEDDNVMRKSDIVISDTDMKNQSNTSSHLSKLFNQVYKSSDYSFDSKENNDGVEIKESIHDNKNQFKTVNGILLHPEVVTDNVDIAINEMIAQKKPVPKENPSKGSWNNKDVYTQNTREELDEDLILDETNDTRENVIVKDKAEKLLEDIGGDSKDKELEKGMKIYKSNNKISQNNSDKSDSKIIIIDQKTASENSKAFDKAKLLAAMKAIDDNENIEFVDQKSRRNSANRVQITENLYRGIPTHSKKKNELLKELFAEPKSDNKTSSKEN